MKKEILIPVLGIAALGTAYAQIPQKPNILWVMSEDMGQDLGCYGMQAVKTPVLDKMAAEGVQYNAACCTNPISSPSRSAMITGAYQVVTGTHNHRSNRDIPLDSKYKPFTYYLREAGYTTILGHSNVFQKGRKTDVNFKHTPVGEWDGVENFGLFDKFDEYTAEDQPFFAQVQLAVTHRGDWWNKVTAESKHPVNPADVVLPPYLPDDPAVRKEYASYMDQIERMDDEMGMLLEDLKAKGLLDNTIIFFIGDNGRCEVRGKGYLYEPGLKIPMIAWGKGIKATQVNDIVSTLDITATILDLAGIERPDYYEGKPLFNKKNGKSTKGRKYFYGCRDTWDEIPECIRSMENADYKYIRNYFPETPWDSYQEYLELNRPAIHILRRLNEEGKLNDAQKLFLAKQKPAEELYDLKNDPFELNNLAENPEYKLVLRKMRSKMDKWQRENDDKGLADRNDRHPEAKFGLVDYIKANHPDDWAEILDGVIFDKYHEYGREMKQSQKKSQKKKK